MSIPQHWQSRLQPEGQLWGEEREPANHWGRQESQMTGCGAKSPTFYRAQDPAIQSQHPIAHVVLVRFISRETTTSKQHRAQLISTQTFSGQVHFEWERLTPTGSSSRRRASLCAWVRGQPGEQQGERAWEGSNGAEDPPAWSGYWQHAG